MTSTGPTTGGDELPPGAPVSDGPWGLDAGSAANMHSRRWSLTWAFSRMKNHFSSINLPGEYSVRQIAWTDYRTACEAYERAVFGPEAMSNYDGPHSETFFVCLGIFDSEELIGWHYSHELDGDVLMRDTGILPAHQRQGIYSALLPPLLAYFKSCGFGRVRSRHEFENNAVLITKLRNGFVVTGTEIDKGVSYIKLAQIFDA